MAEALVVIYGHPPDTSPAKMNRLRNALFGYTDRSNKGKYVYERKGVLTGRPFLALKHTLIIPVELGPEVESLILQEGAWVWMRRVRLTREDEERLRAKKRP